MGKSAYEAAEDWKCDDRLPGCPGADGRGDGSAVPSAVPGDGRRAAEYGDGQRQGDPLQKQEHRVPDGDRAGGESHCPAAVRQRSGDPGRNCGADPEPSL